MGVLKSVRCYISKRPFRTLSCYVWCVQEHRSSQTLFPAAAAAAAASPLWAKEDIPPAARTKATSIKHHCYIGHNAPSSQDKPLLRGVPFVFQRSGPDIRRERRRLRRNSFRAGR